MSKRDVVVLGAARSPIGTFAGSLADIDLQVKRWLRDAYQRDA